VGLAARPELAQRLGSPEGAALVSAYGPQLRQLAARGATVIVLPEVAFLADAESPDDQLRPLTSLAAEAGADLVVGVAVGGSANRAVVLGSGGAAARWYQKHHVVPGWERAYEPGRDLLLVPPQWGVIICKDLDFPRLVRRYRRAGAALLLAPAWDFKRDGWLHSRMAVMRGVECGVAIARVARAGRATVSDAAGRIIVDAPTDEPTAVDALVAPGLPTAYSRLGDWFGWLCVAATACVVALAWH
jgi:apolipoprotein N-acyltransferase